MRVLVTGGAGYIGSNLVDELISGGHEVLVVDNLSTGKLTNVQHLLSDERFHLVQDTILNAALMDQMIAQVDQVYHLAAVVGVKYVLDDPLSAISTNVRGTEVVLEQAAKHRRPVVIASSSEVYGKSTAVPLHEEDDRLLGSTKVARWSYAAAKAIDEHLAFAYAGQGLPVSVVRYFNSYGPRLDPNGYGSVIAKFITQARLGRPITLFGDGHQTRCFTYVADTVRGTLLAGTSPEAMGQVFNIGSDRETKVIDLARMIRDITGSASEIIQVPYRDAYGENFEETQRRVPDVRRATRILGFRAETPLEQGLRQTLAWFERTWPHARLVQDLDRPASVLVPIAPG